MAVQTFRYQSVMNRVARGLLAVPLLSRLVGRALLTLYVVGRKSGTRYTVPMAYVRHNDVLVGCGESRCRVRGLRRSRGTAW